MDIDLQDKIYIALDDISNYADIKKLSDKELLVEILDNISTEQLLKLAEKFNAKCKEL